MIWVEQPGSPFAVSEPALWVEWRTAGGGIGGTSHPIVSDLKLTWAGGRIEPVKREEHPQLLFDAKGRAIALTVAILDLTGHSWNVTIPIKKQ